MTTRMRQLDRIVRLQSRSVTRDRFGGEVVSWTDAGELWASVRITGVREQYVSNANRERATRNAIMRVHYDDRITEAGHRIIYDNHAWDIIGIDPDIGRRRWLDLTVETEIGGEDFQPRHYAIMAGLSDDATADAAEFTLSAANGRIEFPAFTDKHILLWRDASEPDLTVFELEADPTHDNQFPTFTKQAATLALNGAAGNVWVSNHALTFPEAMAARVA